MWQFIVSGYVPGTNYQITFEQFSQVAYSLALIYFVWLLYRENKKALFRAYKKNRRLLKKEVRRQRRKLIRSFKKRQRRLIKQWTKITKRFDRRLAQVKSTLHITAAQ